MGKAWLAKSGFVLLLDGLDEVREPLRESCIDALNEFRQQFGTIEIAICSRIADFQKLTTTLEHFQAAVFIQPLDEMQIEDYLQEVGKPLKQVKMALQQDPTLLEFAKTPLLLWILSLAYRDQSADELLNLPQPERLRRLFDRYIEQMFLKRPMANGDCQKMIRWLSILAQRMGSNKEFLIERMQPQDWLITTKKRRTHKLLFCLFITLTIGVMSGFFVHDVFAIIIFQILGILFGIKFYLISPTYFIVEDINILFLNKIPFVIIHEIKALSKFNWKITLQLFLGATLGSIAILMYKLLTNGFKMHYFIVALEGYRFPVTMLIICLIYWV